MNSKDYDEMNSIMEESAHVNAFIKDYILKFRMADIANNSIEYVSSTSSYSYNTTERINNSYITSSKKIIDDFNNEILDKCSKDNVINKCENDSMNELKDDINNIQKKYFDKIIYQYNHVSDFGYNSGRLSDQMLYDMYLGYITSDDFYYDDSNPYVVELFHHITTFMQIRSRLELNGSNIAGLIAKFNTMCDTTIRKYWNGSMYDYYARMKEIFLYDFYTDDENELIQAKINDDKRTTLYSKVMKYLETLCNYTPPKSAEEKYKNMDPNDIINNAQISDTEDEKESKQLYSNLRKIAIYFVQLRKVENDFDPEYFTTYISSDDYNDIFTLLDELSDDLSKTKTEILSVKDYIIKYNESFTNSKQGSSNSSTAMTSYLGFEKKYTEPFQRLARHEAKILRDLSDRAIKFYLDNNDAIMDGSIFDKYREVAWGSKAQIMKDNIIHDFYFIEDPKRKDDKKDEYEYTETSTKTRYGVSDFEYWVRYCGVATIVNCMMPGFWATGLVIDGIPIPMPIIYIPQVLISGRVTIVIGMGICGICTLPMILFVNMCDFPGSLIPAINMAIDTLRGLVSMIPSLNMIQVNGMVQGLITVQDQKITELNKQKEEIKQNITYLQESVKTDKETLRNIKKMRKENSTSTSRKKKSNE